MKYLKPNLKPYSKNFLRNILLSFEDFERMDDLLFDKRYVFLNEMQAKIFNFHFFYQYE